MLFAVIFNTFPLHATLTYKLGTVQNNTKIPLTLYGHGKSFKIQPSQTINLNDKLYVHKYGNNYFIEFGKRSLGKERPDVLALSSLVPSCMAKNLFGYNDNNQDTRFLFELHNCKKSTTDFKQIIIRKWNYHTRPVFNFIIHSHKKNEFTLEVSLAKKKFTTV